MPSLRWHYPDQVNGFVLSRTLLVEGQHPMARTFEDSRGGDGEQVWVKTALDGSRSETEWFKSHVGTLRVMAGFGGKRE
jgi:hypothetical protein